MPDLEGTGMNVRQVNCIVVQAECFCGRTFSSIHKKGKVHFVHLPQFNSDSRIEWGRLIKESCK